MAPGEKVVNDQLFDQVPLQQQAQYLGAKQSLDMLGVEPRERPEGAAGREAAVGEEHVDMWMKVEQLARGLDEPDGSRGDGRAIEVGFEVEFEGSPRTAGELAQKLPVVAEEDPQPLGDGEDHLAVGDILEQLLAGPVRPQELALLVAAWTQTPKLAREGDEELMPAVRASHSGDAVVEHAAIEIAAISRKKDRQRIVRRIVQLAEDPQPPGCQKFSGRDRYRIRQGPYRIVYSIEDDRLIVFVVKVGKRSEVYRGSL